MSEQFIRLGKQFVEELGLDRGSNTLTRWMAHYVAEKIKATEHSEGAEKEKAEQECFDTILKLWQQRWELPQDCRPFEAFEGVFNMLGRIDPSNREQYYFQRVPQRYRDKEVEIPKQGTVEYWVRIAEEIDNVARVWIYDALVLASEAAEDESTKSWLRNSAGLPHSYDRSVIEILLADGRPTDDEIDKQLEHRLTLETVKSRIEELERYARLNEFFLQRYKLELAEMEGTGGSDEGA